MSEDQPDQSDREPEYGIVRMEIDPDPKTAEHDLLAVIADIEGVAIEELPSLYREVNHFVEQLFDTPPSTDAQMEISFSYAGYRVTLARSGSLKLVPVKDTIPDG